MINDKKIERYLKRRPAGMFVTAATIVRVLGISRSSTSQILQAMVAEGVLISERILIDGRGQPTLAYRWKSE